MYIVPDGIIVMKIHILKPEKGNSVFLLLYFGLLPKMNISYFFVVRFIEIYAGFTVYHYCEWLTLSLHILFFYLFI